MLGETHDSFNYVRLSFLDNKNYHHSNDKGPFLCLTHGLRNLRTNSTN